MELRTRQESTNYSGESRSDNAFTVDSIESTSRWGSLTVSHLKIKVIDVNELFSTQSIDGEATKLIMPEWKDGSWLESIESAHCDSRVKSLLCKIRQVYIAGTAMTEMYIDGFMNTLLQILCFDNYPCLLYPQYSYWAKIGPKNKTVNAKSDFSVILSNMHQMLLVVEDKTTSNANRTNNWKEDQVLGELFVAVHRERKYPATVYAVRVVGTLFTFYRATATAEYVLESAQLGKAVQNEMVIQRYPPVEKSPILTAYDICEKDDRMRILECMCSIRQSSVQQDTS